MELLCIRLSQASVKRRKMSTISSHPLLPHLGLEVWIDPLSSIALLSWGQEAGFQSTGSCSAVRYAPLSREDASQRRHHHKAQNSTRDLIYYRGSLWNAGERLFWYERRKKIQH